METTGQVTELTRKELINLFSAVLCNSLDFGADYDPDFYRNMPDGTKHGQCFEDKLADILLNGGEITFEDYRSEGSSYSDFGEVLTNEDGREYGSYKMTLPLLLSRLSDIMNGACGKDARVSFGRMFFDNDYDHTDADNIMQAILFGEVIY